MGRAWVPPAVDRKLREESNVYTASVESMVERFRGVLGEFNPLLRDLDPYLELIFAPPNAEAAGLTPGRYHVMRHNPDAPPSLMVIEGPDGEFVEPTSRLLDELRAKDMWSPEAMRDRDERKRQRAVAREAEKQRETEDRQQEILERWLAVSRTFVSLDQSSPWTQNRAGRRAAARKRR